MIVRMTTASRPQRRYDHRLRDLVQRTGDLTIATDLGVPRSTARGWLAAAPRVVVGLEVADLTEPELRQEILKLRRRVEKLAALLRLALALVHASGFSLSRERLPEEDAKRRILRAVDRARECLPLRAVLRFLRLSPSRFYAWRRRQTACALDYQSSCPRTSPHRLRPSEVQAIGAMVTSPEYRHVPTGTLAVLAQRLGTVSASPSTWYRLVRKYGWRRPRVRVHPAKPKVGLRTTGPDEMWHIDTTVIRLLDGTAPICTPSSTTSLDGFWRGAWPTRSHPPPALPCCSRPVGARPVRRVPQSYWRTRAWRTSMPTWTN